MSTILAVDTSCEACSIALLQGPRVESEFVQAPRQHTQRLLPMIDGLLRAHQLTLADLDAIAYGRGPGSFTGLRICLGVVQGLAYSMDLPVIPVSTLHAMAVGAVHSHQLADATDILVALDARMNEVYWAVFTVKDGFPTPKSQEFVSDPSDVAEFLSSEASDSLTVSNSLVKVGAGCHYQPIQEIPADLEDITLLPRAEHMLVLADKDWQSGRTLSAENTQPVYLRDSVAWKKRKRIRQA